MTNNKGITLIALVITIIVLLILAGVSIAMLTGQNGILNQATKAKDDTAKAEVAERINLELQALYSSVLADNTKETFTDAEKTKVQNNLQGYTVTLDSTNKIITISKDGKTGTVTITTAGTATVDYAEK